MLRKLIFLAITSGLAKKAFLHFRSKGLGDRTRSR